MNFFLVSYLSVAYFFVSVLTQRPNTGKNLTQNTIVDPIRSELKPVRNLTSNSNTTRIVYPSEDTNKNRRPSHHNRLPVSDVRLCKDNELLYPGDNEGDWVCDCKPSYLHYPATGLCYEAYTQGPCKRGEILKLLNESMSNIPQCVRNECNVGQVLYLGKCFPLNGDEGCADYSKFIGRKVLLVADPTTSGLICADEDFTYECVNNCCLGSKREYRNVCRTDLERRSAN